LSPELPKFVFCGRFLTVDETLLLSQFIPSLSPPSLPLSASVPSLRSRSNAMADDLKVLGFVATLGNTAVSAASAAWSKSKSYVSPSITSAVEERASPLVASAADAAGGALVSLDQKVTGP
jgi:hypothetical protein